MKKQVYIFFIIFALYITNSNANNNETYLKYSLVEDAPSYAGNSVFRICDIPSSIGLVFFKMKRTNGIKWTKKEKSYLIKNYPNTNNEVLSKQLNKTIPSILGIAKMLRIFKSDEFLFSLRSKSQTKFNKSVLSERFDNFLKKANELHNGKYDYSRFKYLNSHKKGIIICPIHGEFKESSNKHLCKDKQRISGCRKCWDNKERDTLSKRFNWFLKRANEMHNDKFDYSKFIYVDAKTEGIIICPVHGEFRQMPDKHLAKNAKGCTKCWFEILKEIVKEYAFGNIEKEHLPKEYFLKRCEELFGDKFKYDLTNYNGVTKNKIKITCPIHGQFEQIPISHIYNNSTGCFKCGKEKARKSMTDDYDYFIEQSKKEHKNKYTYPESNRDIYKNKKSVIKIICDIHGEFDKKAQNHVCGQGCFKCKIHELIKKNILVGGYIEELFLRKPFLKIKPAYLYYLKINDGELYKIGITTTNINNRISGIKSKSKKVVNKVEVIKIKEYNLYDAFKAEQKIIFDFKKFRVLTFWSNELFSKNILSKILNYFN